MTKISFLLFFSFLTFSWASEIQEDVVKAEGKQTLQELCKIACVRFNDEQVLIFQSKEYNQLKSSNHEIFLLKSLYTWNPTSCPPPFFFRDITRLNLKSSKLGEYLKQFPDHLNFLKNMPYLKDLNISWNYLQTSAAGVLKNLSGLKSLDISWNYMAEQVKYMTHLRDLTILNINNNNLGSEVHYLHGLTNLEVLDVSWNKLSNHVNHLSSLTNLYDLDVSGNDLNSNLSFLTNLRDLSVLSIRANNLGSHVAFLGRLTNLWKLNVSENSLGSDVNHLIGLKNLGVLDVYNNRLSREEELLLVPLQANGTVVNFEAPSK